MGPAGESRKPLERLAQPTQGMHEIPKIRNFLKKKKLQKRRRERLQGPVWFVP
jgi:hypothetical protein